MTLLVIASGDRVSAHSSSTAMLHLDRHGETLQGRLEIPIRDLDDLLGLDANDDGALTWLELRGRERDITDYVAGRFGISQLNSPVAIRWEPILVRRRSTESHAVLDFTAGALTANHSLKVHYSVLVEHDPLHRCLIDARWIGSTAIAGRGSGDLEFAALPTRTGVQGSLIREGMHHIWTGYDHLLFLMALLLPAVLRRTGSGWVPVSTAGDVIREVVRVVTAFTIAHSVTLSAAALGWVHLPPRLVETTIAASILIAAGINLLPVSAIGGAPAEDCSPRSRFRGVQPWTVAFVFGLIHGFGFASVLGELALPGGRILLPLIGFNAGVELGQLAVVAAFLPIALLLRRSVFYRNAILPWGSSLILLAACAWMMERALEVRFMPF